MGSPKPTARNRSPPAAPPSPLPKALRALPEPKSSHTRAHTRAREEIDHDVKTPPSTSALDGYPSAPAPLSASRPPRSSQPCS